MNLTGSTLGNYQIIEELGRGGMAVVYRAYQPSLNRYVAIKVLPPQLSFDQQFIQRFQREARAAAGLRHPNIVVIHDVGHADDTYYIVMEYLEGQTLKDLIEREGSLHPRRVARIVEQVAAALDYAHQRGLVHRDVKPANIFVGQGDHVTLTDFGIAKAASETQQLTRTGMLMGTPEYMSPEQAEGSTVDHRTDLYALGVVLYQMLVGRVPFRGTTPHAVLHNVIYEAPTPPRQINPNVSTVLEAIILKAVAKSPGQRFQRGAELVKALREGLKRGGVPAPLAAGGQGAAAPPAGTRAARTPARARPDRDRPATRPRRPATDRGSSAVIWILGGIAVVLVVVIGLLLLLLAGGDSGDATPTGMALQPTATPVVAPSDTAEPEASEVPPTAPTTVPTPVPSTSEPTPVPIDTPTATGTVAPGTTPPFIPSHTPPPTPIPPDTPTATPTLMPSPTPTSPCPLAVDGELAPAWDRGRLGCATGPANITWAAWEPFERGHMFWRDDINRVYVLHFQGGTNTTAGDWREILDEWDGSNPDGVGMSPPPGLHEPKRGFGWVWRTYLGGPSGDLGWARDIEKGFCAKIQPFERGLLLHSNTVEFCLDNNYNYAREPSFPTLFFAFYGDGTWRRY